MGSIADQLNGESVRRALQHTKRLTKYQIAHDVEHHPVAPVGNVPRIIPPVFALGLCAISSFLQQPTCRPDVCQDVPLERLDSLVTKRMAHHSPFPGMLHLVNAAVNIDCRLARGKSGVKVGFAHIRAESIDGFERRGRVDAQRVWPNADYGPVNLMGAVVCEMPRAPVSIVSKVDVGYTRERWSGVARKRMQSQPVDDYSENLFMSVTDRWLGIVSIRRE